jgi:AraC-like DNA-binding protein
MTLVVREPVGALAAFVRSITYESEDRIAAGLERVLPDAGMSLWVNLNVDEFRVGGGDGRRAPRRLPGGMLEGPRDRAALAAVEEGRAHLCVRFTLGVAPPLFRVPPGAVRNDWVSLEDLWGRDGASVRERLLEAATPEDQLRILEGILADRLRDTVRPDPAVLRGMAALDRGEPVSAVAGELGLLPRTFRRRFLGEVGLTPKRFARVRRLRRVVRAIEGRPTVDWSAVAAEHGYCDQAHLIDEFRDLAGLTPAAFLRETQEAPAFAGAPWDQ